MYKKQIYQAIICFALNSLNLDELQAGLVKSNTADATAVFNQISILEQKWNTMLKLHS